MSTIWDPLPPWPTEAPVVDHAEARRRALERKKRKPKNARRPKSDFLTAKIVGGPSNGQKLRMEVATAPDRLVLDMGRSVYMRRRWTNEWLYEGPVEVPSEDDLKLVTQEYDLTSGEWMD